MIRPTVILSIDDVLRYNNQRRKRQLLKIIIDRLAACWQRASPIYIIIFLLFIIIIIEVIINSVVCIILFINNIVVIILVPPHVHGHGFTYTPGFFHNYTERPGQREFVKPDKIAASHFWLMKNFLSFCASYRSLAAALFSLAKVTRRR